MTQDTVRKLGNLLNVLPQALFFVGVPIIGVTGASDHPAANKVLVAWIVAFASSIVLARRYGFQHPRSRPRGIE